MRSGADPGTLAAGLSLPEMQRRVRQRIHARDDALLAMLRVSASNLAHVGHAHGAHPAGAHHVVPGDLLGDPVEDADRRTGPAAPTRRVVEGRLAAAPQADGSHA